MKSSATLIFLFLVARLSGQAVVQPDTLMYENFQSDPSSLMDNFPSGQDFSWINYDADGTGGFCVEDNITPHGWYWEGDLGFQADNNNYAFTSCSFIEQFGAPVYNDNWLILPPVFVPDASYTLQWRSMSFSGPIFHDGYKVLVSTGSNNPDDGGFIHTIFQMSDMLAAAADPDNLNPAAYIFTPGYIQANTYTDTAYFHYDVYEDIDGDHPYLHGKLEPHSVSLSNFTGQTIYIAFRHRARNNWMMQLDDISVSQTTTAVRPGPEGLTAFHISPNPVTENTVVRWKFLTPTRCRVFVADLLGQTCWVSDEYKSSAENIVLPENLAPGTYILSLRTSQGSLASRKFIKF